LPPAKPFGKSPETIVRSETPFNSGPAPEALARHQATPNDLFFVRNHGDVPAIDAARHLLKVEGEVERPLTLSLADLAARFPRREITATLQCAGNRRQELIDVRPIPNELPWGSEAISNARWAGVALADVLAAAGPTATARHAAFHGLDATERHGQRFTFGGSIPIAKALAPEVLLAWEMNGEPLPPVHGAPLRALVPGWIGARSVKWLAGITLQGEPSENYFQRVAYRLFPAATGPENVVWDAGTMLGDQPVNSIATTPRSGATLPAGAARFAGVAFAGGGRVVTRVELSLDGGGSWRQADLAAVSSPWAWRHWEISLDLPAGEHEVAVRAWDDAANTQPSAVEQVWNFKGYANNAWQRVRVRCTDGGTR
jgi:sulfite oxidase